jgi:hypothetical protein
MPLTLDKLIGAYKQVIPMVKTNSTTTVAGLPSTLIDRAGFPAASSLNPSQTTNGIVPVDTDAGYPDLDNASGSNKLYLSRVSISANVAMSVDLYDVLFLAGQTTIPTSSTTTVALTSRPSFSGRVPFLSDGVTRDWSRVELFLYSAVAWSNHAHTASIDYLDQGGAAGNTGNVSTQNFAINRMLRMPLAAGDTGVQEITGYNLNGITSAAGAVVAMAARRLGSFRTQGGLSSLYGPDYTGLPELFGTSAILMVCRADSTSSGTPDVVIEIAHMDPSA